MGNTTKRWKNFWDRRRQRKAEKLHHPEGDTRTLDQAKEAFWQQTEFGRFPGRRR